MSSLSEEIEKSLQNQKKAKIITKGHAIREKLLVSIRDANAEQAQKMLQEANAYLSVDDPMDLLGRIEGSQLRSHKNFMLSHNSMYALMAEFGGLDQVLSHYLSEKYAILIESSKASNELERLHDQMVEKYSSPKHRFAFNEDMPLSLKVQNYIANHFMNDLNIQMIADEFYVTKEHLMRQFKKEMGITVNDEIKKSRLDEAEDMLQSSHLSVTNIAMLVGYNSVQYFSTVFKEVYGVTPTEIQKQKNK